LFSQETKMQGILLHTVFPQETKNEGHSAFYGRPFSLSLFFLAQIRTSSIARLTTILMKGGERLPTPRLTQQQ